MADKDDAHILSTEAELLKKSEENIEKYRKGDANVQFTDQNGRPIEGVEVEVNQRESDFRFGTLSSRLCGMTLMNARPDFSSRDFWNYSTSAFFPSTGHITNQHQANHDGRT
ncbi:hypothetical protein ACFL6S_31310 [Candidatus Poribacteria bacterium]